MQVYHTTDPTTAHTLEQLFAQMNPPPLPQLTAPQPSQLGPTHQTLAPTFPDLLQDQTSDQLHTAAVAHQAAAGPGPLAGPHVTSPVRLTGRSSSSTHVLQPSWQQRDLTAQARLVAEHVRQELLESGMPADV